MILITKGDRATIPGVFTHVEIHAEKYDMRELHIIMNKVTIKSGDVMDFNSFMHVAGAVANHYGLGDIEKDIETFYAQFAGNPITIQSVIIFWMFILRRYKKND